MYIYTYIHISILCITCIEGVRTSRDMQGLEVLKNQKRNHMEKLGNDMEALFISDSYKEVCVSCRVNLLTKFLRRAKYVVRGLNFRRLQERKLNAPETFNRIEGGSPGMCHIWPHHKI